MLSNKLQARISEQADPLIWKWWNGMDEENRSAALRRILTEYLLFSDMQEMLDEQIYPLKEKIDHALQTIYNLQGIDYPSE